MAKSDVVEGSSQSTLDQMMALLVDVRQSQEKTARDLDSLASRVDRYEATIPRVEKMLTGDEDFGLEIVEQNAQRKTSESLGTKETFLTGPAGHRLPEGIEKAIKPRFKKGEIVRINPDAVRVGFPDNFRETPASEPRQMIWRDRLAKYKSNGYAKIIKIVRLEVYADGRVEYRYRIACKNIATFQGLDVDEHELLAAA